MNRFQHPSFLLSEPLKVKNYVGFFEKNILTGPVSEVALHWVCVDKKNGMSQLRTR